METSKTAEKPNIFLMDGSEHARDLSLCADECKQFTCPICGGFMHFQAVWGPSHYYQCGTCDNETSSTTTLQEAADATESAFPDSTMAKSIRELANSYPNR